jgi:hypothetical protein
MEEGGSVFVDSQIELIGFVDIWYYHDLSVREWFFITEFLFSLDVSLRVPTA